ncbi:MAG: flagellar hook-length control protein FliK [Terriglobales bacterium]
MIACSPTIVISPTPTTGQPANSSPGPSGDLFSAALQAATRNLLHPSPKSQVGSTNLGPQKPAVNSKTDSPSLQSPNQDDKAASLLIPAVPTPLAGALLQPPTVDEAKLQAATLSAEQNESTIENARVGIAAAGTQTAPSGPIGARQFVPVALQFGPGTAGIPTANTDVPAGLGMAPLPASVSGPAQPTVKGNTPDVIQQPKPQPWSGLDLSPLAAGKKEAASIAADSPIALNALTNQHTLPAHPASPASPPVPATPPATASATPSANAGQSVPNQTEHSGTNDAKNHNAPAAAAPDASSAPQIPLQLVTPDINVTKLSPRPQDALHTAAPTGNSTMNSATPATEIPKKNGDAGGNGNTQSGAGKGNTSTSFGSTSLSSQPDTNVAPASNAGDGTTSGVLAGVQVAHGAVSTNDASAASAKTSTPAAEALRSPTAGTTEADARVQAAASYANSLLHSARLVERAGQTELRVGVQTGEFGNVDIRTSMVRNQFTAQISVERGDLGKVLAAELPSLQNKLSEQRLPMANITLQNQSGGASAGSGQGSQQNQRMQQMSIPQSSEADFVPSFAALAEASTSSGRLDVHM